MIRALALALLATTACSGQLVTIGSNGDAGAATTTSDAAAPQAPGSCDARKETETETETACADGGSAPTKPDPAPNACPPGWTSLPTKPGRPAECCHDLSGGGIECCDIFADGHRVCARSSKSDGGGPPKPDGGRICSPGADWTCNDDPMISSIHGKCDADGLTCYCLPQFPKNPTTGRCL